MFTFENSDKNLTLQDESVENMSIYLNITQIRSHLNFGNKKVKFYVVTLKWHRSTCYVNWAFLIGDLVGVTTVLLLPTMCPLYPEINRNQIWFEPGYLTI